MDEFTKLLLEMNGKLTTLVDDVSEIKVRLLPVEDDYKFRAKLRSLMMGGSGLVALLSTVFALAKVIH